MDINHIIELLKSPDIEYIFYFVRKTKTEYISYSPEVSKDIFIQLLNIICKYLEGYSDFEQVDFNPTGYREGTIELCDLDYVGNYNEVINSFDSGNIEDVEKEADNFSFYCIDLNIDDNNNIKLFRRVTKFKRLYSKGILAAFQGNRLNKIEDKMLGLDGEIDIIVFKDKMIVLNHISLERIFRMEEQYSSKANEAINKLRNSNKIVNFDAFEEDCMNDLRIQKILTRMLKEGNELDKCFDNFNNVIETINLFDLDIEVQNTPSQGIIYEDKRQIMDVLRLARDSYYRSLIREKPGIDNKI